MSNNQLTDNSEQLAVSRAKKRSGLATRFDCKRQLCSLLIVLCSLLSVPCFAENEFSLSLAPAMEAPVNVEYLSPGFGAAASLDWAFRTIGSSQFAKKFNLGLSAGGTFVSIPVQVGEPLSLFEGKLGPFARWQPFDRWAFNAGLNAGIYQYLRGDVSETKALFSFKLGGEFKLSPYFSLFTEGSYTYRAFTPTIPLSSLGATFGIRLNLTEIMTGRARVQVEKTEQYRVFPVSWAWYEHNPIAMVKITNEEPNIITDINLSFFMDSYMIEPWTFATLPRLAPGEGAEVPVTALFNEVMINLTENTNAAGMVQIQYRSLGTRKESVTPVQMPIFHRNAFSWEDDRRAAAFVSPRDGSAHVFARYVAGAVEAQPQMSNIPDNVRYAIAMFEALRLYGINYVVVPATSYKNISANESALDNVSYPYQALYYRGGDCTYLSILFCSLLESLKIETAFITIPGHLYMAFEVGDSNWQPESNDIINLNGNDGIRRRWLPLEITVPDQGFTRAWRVGASEWRANGTEAALYPIREAWELYPPVTVPASADHQPEMPERSDIVRAAERERAKL